MNTTHRIVHRHPLSNVILHNMYRILVIAAFAAFPVRAAAQLPAGTTPPNAEMLAARIDSVVKTDILPRGFPGVSIAVTRGGRTLLERAWGVANVNTGQKAEPATTYNIGSMSKQFTASMILKLVDAGKLSLTDPVGRYVKGLRPEWNAITIEQLLRDLFEKRIRCGKIDEGIALIVGYKFSATLDE